MITYLKTVVLPITLSKTIHVAARSPLQFLQLPLRYELAFPDFKKNLSTCHLRDTTNDSQNESDTQSDNDNQIDNDTQSEMMLKVRMAITARMMIKARMILKARIMMKV